jgi:hypothetical protein
MGKHRMAPTVEAGDYEAVIGPNEKPQSIRKLIEVRPAKPL